MLASELLRCLHPQAATRQHSPSDLADVEELDDLLARVADACNRIKEVLYDGLAVKPQDGLDQIFFRLEIPIQRALGYAAPRQDCLHACCVEATFVEAIERVFDDLELLACDLAVLAPHVTPLRAGDAS